MGEDVDTLLKVNQKIERTADTKLGTPEGEALVGDVKKSSFQRVRESPFGRHRLQATS